MVEPAGPAAARRPVCTGTKGLNVIDVLVAALVSEALTDSAAKVRLRLAHTARWPAVRPPRRGEPGAVADPRDKYGADLVSVLAGGRTAHPTAVFRCGCTPDTP
ncbi:hypothetical protein [Streptomyces sp. NPDC052225]|uniref:hypothetical protein n=1 Tax=Streptomyces sp. NPDC052225 TaxID=3154949 RepID=UPI003424CBA9